MHAVFVACLLGGVAATALFLLIGVAGGALGHASHGMHLHDGSHGPHVHAPGSHETGGSHTHSLSDPHAAAQHGGPAHVLSSSLGWTLSWISPLAVAVAAVWFGVVGLLTEGSGLAVVFALLAAIAAAAIVRSAMRAFVRASVPPLTLGGEGAIGKINAAILPDSTGEVIYTLEGLHRTAPARALGGEVLPRGTEVIIVRREKGIAWVEPLDPLLKEPVTLTTRDTEPEGTVS